MAGKNSPRSFASIRGYIPSDQDQLEFHIADKLGKLIEGLNLKAVVGKAVSRFYLDDNAAVAFDQKKVGPESVDCVGSIPSTRICKDPIAEGQIPLRQFQNLFVMSGLIYKASLHALDPAGGDFSFVGSLRYRRNAAAPRLIVMDQQISAMRRPTGPSLPAHQLL
jgi:hypothetical protein